MSARGRHPHGRGDPARRPDHRRRGEVIAALERLGEGTCARCDICGVQISDRLLHLAPVADRCMHHLLYPSPRRNPYSSAPHTSPQRGSSGWPADNGTDHDENEDQ